MPASFLICIGVAASSHAANDGRVSDGLQILYDFSDAASDELNSLQKDRVSFNQSLAHFSSNGRLEANQSQADSLTTALKRSSAITIEVWLKASNRSQSGPARIITLSRDTSNRNFTIGQEGSQIQVRIRHSGSDTNGLPGLTANVDSIDKSWHHIVATHQAGQPQNLFINGKKFASAKHQGKFDNWQTKMKLCLGDEVGGGRSWQGSLALVAVYNQALTTKQIEQNYQCGYQSKSNTIKPAQTTNQNLVTSPHSPFATADTHFRTEIAPLLARHCLQCHDSAVAEGGLDLSHKATAFSGGASGNALVSGHPDRSLVWTSVQNDEMPHDRPPLSTAEKEILRNWIQGGALWSLDYVDPSIYRHSADSQRWVRRLTVDEYVQTVSATLGVNIRDEAEQRLPKDVRADGFNNTAYNLTVDFGHVSAYAELAETIVKNFDVIGYTKRFTSKQDFTDKNVRPLVESIGKHLLRAPLNDDEIALYRGITTTTALSGGTFEQAVGYVIRAMLQSPKFLYRVEKPAGDRQFPYQSDPYELASRMSYTVWGGPPDEILMQAASQDALASEQAIREQLKRMWKDPRAIERSLRFASQWLNLDRLQNLSPNEKHFPDWQPEIAEEMKRETLDTFRYWVWELNKPLVGLLDAPVTFASPALAHHYGITPQGNGWTRYDLSKEPSRQGILTHGSLLTIGGDDASMVTRGLFVLQDLLFSEVGDPPPGLDLTPVPTAPGRTHRMVAVDRIQSEACGGCHKRFEPLAFALERYDGLGSFSKTDHHGNELREDGEILFPGQSKPVAYKTTAELTQILAKSDRVAECLTRKVVQFSIGRPLDALDAKRIEQIYQQAGGKRATYQDIVTETLVAFP